MKYKIQTLGCKVNQFETQALETMLKARGVVPAGESESADVVIVNTCAVTAESGRKSRQAIRRIEGENPGAVVAVCGCYAQISPDDVAALGVAVVHGSGDKTKFADDILAALCEKKTVEYTDDPFSRRVMEELPGGAVDGRTRAMLKIEDGCVNFCTYCVIPYARGRVRSLPPERCSAQAGELAAEGFRELVVTGIEIASYGKDLEPTCTLADAIEAIAGASGEMRIRLGSLEPTVVTEDFCQRLKATGKVCDHFHLSLQSGCDRTLKNMNRKYDTARFYESVCLLREAFPDCGLTCDLIVGFPGETEEDHRASLDFIRKCGFSAVHVFPYSKRPGTKAADMPGHLPNAVKAARASDAQTVADEAETEYLRACVGKTLPVLFEREEDELSIGHASNYTQVCVHKGHLRKLVENVKISGIIDKMLVGKIV